MAVFATLGAREVKLSERTDFCPCALFFEVKSVVSFLDADVAHFTPILTPGVAHLPVLDTLVDSPPDDRDNVVYAASLLFRHTTGIVEDGSGVDTTADRTALEDFFGHVAGTRHSAVRSNSGVRISLQTGASSAIGRESRASAGNVHIVALPVTIGTETILGLRRAGQVRVGSFVRDASAGLGDFVDPLVRTNYRTAVARTSITAVEHVLNREVDIDALSSTSNLDPVTEGGQGTMSPARSAVLRDVLVTVHGTVVGSVHVAPVQLGGKGNIDVSVGDKVVFDTIGDFLLVGPDFALAGSGSSDGSNKDGFQHDLN